jgi:hypothetical protein
MIYYASVPEKLETEINMQHRHLQGDQISLAKIDDIIERGKFTDWLELASLAESDEHRRLQIQLLASENIQRSERPERASFWIAFCTSLAKRTHPSGNH